MDAGIAARWGKFGYGALILALLATAIVSRTAPAAANAPSSEVEAPDSVAAIRAAADFDGDDVSEIAYFRAAAGLWAAVHSGDGFSYATPQFITWGQAGDIALTGDFDGDMILDPAVRRPPGGGQSAAYLILLSSTGYDFGSSLVLPAGWPGLKDTPVVGDFNGDGISEPAIWRGNTGVWIIALSPTFSTYQFFAWGATGDTPTSADVDGDGQSDIGYFRPSTGAWGFLLSSQGYSYATPQFFAWGDSTSAPVIADYDGDDHADPAYVTPPTGGQSAAYRILLSTTGYDFGQSQTVPAGWPGLKDTPVPADYDADGKADAGIWRGNTGVWILPKSSLNNAAYMFAAWGANGDQPLTAPKQVGTPGDTTAPGQITNLAAATGTTEGTVDLSWTAPGDDGTTGTATSYQVRYSATAITDTATWNAATAVSSGVPAPHVAGTAESMTVSGLTPGETYSFAIRAQDEVPNVGAISNSPSAIAAPDYVAPGPIVDLAADPGSYEGTVDLSWRAPGDDGETGTAMEYQVRRGVSQISAQVDWDAAAPIPSGIPLPQPAGSTESMTVTGLNPGETYFFAVRARDNGSNLGALSNSPSVALVQYPAPITDLSAATGGASGQVILQWTAVGAEGHTGTATSYQVRYSGTIIDSDEKWETASAITTGVPAPSAAGTIETMSVGGLSPATAYFFAVRAEYDAPHANIGGLSNSPTAVAKGSPTMAPCLISSNTTWGQWGSPYSVVTCTLSIAQGATLNITPGTVIKFGSYGMQVNGTLNAVGTTASPVLFTSNLGNPYPGVWPGINFTSTSTNSILDHAVIEYGGRHPPTYSGILKLANTSVQISNSTLRYGGAAGIYADTGSDLILSNNIIMQNTGPGIEGAGIASVTMSGNHFEGNGYYATTMHFTNGVFSSLGSNSATGNGIDAIGIGGSLAADTTLTVDASLPYLIVGGGLTVNPGATLTLPAGCVLKMGPAAYTTVTVNGALQADGTTESPVVITSLKDDSAGGDTNTDGSATSPAHGDWGAILVGGAANLTYTTVAYGGNTDAGVDASVQVSGNGELSLDHGTVRSSAQSGIGAAISLPSFGHVTLANSNVTSNTEDGLRLSGVSLTMSDTAITDNVGFAANLIFNATGTQLSLSGNSASGNGRDAIALTGTIGVPTELAADPALPFVLKSPGLWVGVGGSLMVPAGTIVKAEAGTKLYASGTLFVQGVEGNPVYFTSIRDDSISGDTNKDLSASTPGLGDWTGISLPEWSSGSVIDHAVIDYAGLGGTGSVNIDRASVALTNNVIRHSANYGVYGTNLTDITLTDNSFSDNSSYAAYLGFIEGFTSLAGNSGLGNGRNGLALRGFITRASTLPAVSDFPFIVPQNETIGIGAGGTLNVAAGSVLKFETGAYLWVSQGTLNSLGATGNPVYYTSIRDDSVGGDTNNDEAATSPAAGDWLEIQVGGLGGAADFDYTSIQYGAGRFSPMSDPGSAVFAMSGTTVSMDHSAIRDSLGAGITLFPGDWPDAMSFTLTNSTIERSGGPAIQLAQHTGDLLLVVTGSTLRQNSDGLFMDLSMRETFSATITNNNIAGNILFGIFNPSYSAVVWAPNNWWGAADGPAPYGGGDLVNYETYSCDPLPQQCIDYTAHVNFFPFEATAYPVLGPDP